MDRFGTRVGAAFGWISLIGVTLFLIVIPGITAGQPPTLATGAEASRAYFGHGELMVVYVLSPLIAIAMIPFGLALRNVLRASNERARLAADAGLLFLLATVPLYVISSALGAVLAGEVSGDPNVFEALFRVRVLLYDSAADYLEGAWIGAFALATLVGPRYRWLGWLGVAVAASRWVKGLAPVVALPDAVILIGGIAFLVWWALTVRSMTRIPERAAVATSAIPLPAA